MVDVGLSSHPLDGLDTRRPLGLVLRRDRTLSAGSEAMIALLREHADDNPG